MKTLELVQSCLLALCLLVVCCRSAPSHRQPVDNDADSSNNDSDGRVIYDQRQSGKYNIRISIKDVAIIEMDRNGFGDDTFSEEDYYYDDADLTVKPIKFTTPKPAGTTANNHNASNSTAAAPSTASSSAAITTTISTTTTTGATTQHDRASYSPNLLADIAASQAVSTTKAAAAALTTTPLATTPARKTPSVVTVESTSPYSAPQHSTQRSLLYPNALAARSKHIPVHLALPMESTMHPAAGEKTVATTTTSLQQTPQRAAAVKLAAVDDDSKIFNFKMQRANKSPPQARGAYARHCRHHQYRDTAGNCRAKRSSSSFLRKLFSMFASFPFARVERDHDNE